MLDNKDLLFQRRMGPPCAPHLNILGRSGTQFTSCDGDEGAEAREDDFLFLTARTHDKNAQSI